MTTTKAIPVDAPATSRYAVRFGRSRDLAGVGSYAEASALVCRYVDALIAAGKSSSAFPKVRVLDGQTLKAVGTVSWNGRVWPPGTFTSEMKPLFDPSAEAVREIEATEPDPPAEPREQPLIVPPVTPSCATPAEIPAAKETTMPKSKKTKSTKPTAAKPAAEKAAREKKPRTPKTESPRDPRLPAAGTKIERLFKKKTYVITVLDRGFEWDGREWRSSTALAKEITGAKAISGPRFLGYDRPAAKDAQK
jgi:hypothetical protein